MAKKKEITFFCKECGYETGEKGEHDWQDATCTEPKTCSVCKLTEGEALGHTTRFGKCSTCNEYVYDLQQEFDEICSAFIDAQRDIEYAVDYYEDASYSYYSSSVYFNWSVKSFNDASRDMRIAINACGNYSEFADIRKNLETCQTQINYMEATSSSIHTYGNEVIDYFNLARKAILKYSYSLGDDEL